MVRGLSNWQALIWVALAVAAAVAVLLAARVPAGRWRVAALALVGLAALFSGYVVSGPELELLRPRHWDELVSGLAGGMQALGTVRLPYASADPWPRIVLELLGTELLIFAGLLTFWPRIDPVYDARAPLAVPDRGYPFVALGVLIIVVASPVVSLGGPESLLLGLLLAALSVCFLWLERLPLRPGLGVAALLAIALAGALPLAAMADRGEPWFDYRSFAESLGPDDPVRFSWKQAYGPIDWPRDGNEVMRVTSTEPLYWKARNLDVFDGTSWTVRDEPADNPRGDEPFEADVPSNWSCARLGGARSTSASAGYGPPRSSAPARRSGSKTPRALRGRRCHRAPGMRRAGCGEETPTRSRSESRGRPSASWRTPHQASASARTASASWSSRSSRTCLRR